MTYFLITSSRVVLAYALINRSPLRYSAFLEAEFFYFDCLIAIQNSNKYTARVSNESNDQIKGLSFKYHMSVDL